VAPRPTSTAAPARGPLIVVRAVSLRDNRAVGDSVAQAQGLRALMPLETGKASTPPGTFFWTSPLFLAVDSDFGSHSPGHEFGGDPSPLFPNQYFRVHRLQDGSRLLLAYLSDEGAATVSSLNGQKEVPLVLFPSPWKELRYLVLVPFDRITRAAEREITLSAGEQQSVLDVVLR
jgi:hypothetical protein